MGDRTLIELSLNNLNKAGIEKIVIGTGHQSHWYQKLANKHSNLRCVHAPDYAVSNSMETLLCMHDQLNEDFVLLESDLLYSPKALEALLACPHPNVILAAALSNSHDAVFIQTDAQRNLVALSKEKLKLQPIYAELTGISRVSIPLYQAMCRAYLEKGDKQLHYEEAMQLVAQRIPVFVHKEEPLLWCEIDTNEHYRKAIETIWPRIRAETFSRGELPRNILLNPGPSTTSDGVKMAQVVADICPREQEFGALMHRVGEGLTSLVADTQDYGCVFFAASGTGAVEAAISSVAPHSSSLLIINNGAYGKRMCDIAACYGIAHVEHPSPTTEPLDLAELERRIRQHPEISHLAVVHNETTTGLLNNLEQICGLAKAHKLEVIVDAMSSYAAIPIHMPSLGIDYLCASSNKNIQGMAGVSFVICNRAALKKTNSIAPRSHYFHLYAQYHSQAQSGQMRFTPPVQALYALEQALIETKAEGVAQRYARYTKSWETLIAGLEKLGLDYQVAPEHHSKIITSVYLPPGVDFTAMHDFLYTKGFTIYPGKSSEATCFRIANIGSIDHHDITAFLAHLEEFLAMG